MFVELAIHLEHLDDGSTDIMVYFGIWDLWDWKRLAMETPNGSRTFSLELYSLSSPENRRSYLSGLLYTTTL